MRRVEHINGKAAAGSRMVDSIIRLFDYSTVSLRGFTLIELMLVVAIMGLMGTLSVGGYRAMRQGMEERGVMQNVQGFVKIAYERAMIDGMPTVVYFWNETLKGENDDDSGLQVVGHAVAVRQTGRLSGIDGEYLLDEFGDLRFFAGTKAKGEEDDDSATDQAENSGTTMNLYRMKPGGGFSENRYAVAPTTVPVNQTFSIMSTDNSGTEKSVRVYGYKLMEGSASAWKTGDGNAGGMPYGTEFAELTLPNNYIFESNFKKTTSDPVAEVNKAIWFYPPSADTTAGGTKTISISAIRPGAGGSPAAKSIGKTTDPANEQ